MVTNLIDDVNGTDGVAQTHTGHSEDLGESLQDDQVVKALTNEFAAGFEGRIVDEFGIGFVENEEGILRVRFNPVEDFVAVGNR